MKMVNSSVNLRALVYVSEQFDKSAHVNWHRCVSEHNTFGVYYTVVSNQADVTIKWIGLACLFLVYLLNHS